MEQHSHISKVLEWGVFLENGNAELKPTLYGCTECDATNETSFPSEDIFTDHRFHSTYTDGCFACKITTLELNTGDAGRAESMPQKKWDSELQAYRDARAQGIQPAGTTMKAINEAKEASDKLGVAFNAETMPAAQKITKQTAKVMTETKVI